MFWYKCQIMAGGVAVTKEGDVEGPNALNAMNVIANINRNKWGGEMINCRLYFMDFETGQIAEDPILSWGPRSFSEHAGPPAAKPAKKPKFDYDPYDWNMYGSEVDEQAALKSSHGVSKEDFKVSFGKEVDYSTRYTTVRFKGKEATA